MSGVLANVLGNATRYAGPAAHITLEALFIWLARAANDASQYFGIPSGRAVEVGTPPDTPPATRAGLHASARAVGAALGRRLRPALAGSPCSCGRTTAASSTLTSPPIEPRGVGATRENLSVRGLPLRDERGLSRRHQHPRRCA